MSEIMSSNQSLLKMALTGNAGFSALCGGLMILFDRRLVEFLGLFNLGSLTILGVCLIAYAASLVFSARRPRIRIAEAWFAVVMDLVWVLGSYVLIFLIPFSQGGKWMPALVAEAVLVFAILQWMGIRRIQRASPRVA